MNQQNSVMSLGVWESKIDCFQCFLIEGGRGEETEKAEN